MDNEPYTPTKNKQQDGYQKRHILRWSEDDDQLLILALEKVIRERVNSFPWDEVSKAMDGRASRGAIEQHITKMRKRRAEAGAVVPEKHKRGKGSMLLDAHVSESTLEMGNASNTKSRVQKRGSGSKRGAKFGKSKRENYSDDESDYEATVKMKKSPPKPSTTKTIKEESVSDDEILQRSPKKRKTAFREMIERGNDPESVDPQDDHLDDDHVENQESGHLAILSNDREQEQSSVSKMVVLHVRPELLDHFPNGRYPRDEQALDFIVNNDTTGDLTQEHQSGYSHELSLQPQMATMALDDSFPSAAASAYPSSGPIAAYTTELLEPFKYEPQSGYISHSHLASNGQFLPGFNTSGSPYAHLQHTLYGQPAPVFSNDFLGTGLIGDGSSTALIGGGSTNSFGVDFANPLNFGSLAASSFESSLPTSGNSLLDAFDVSYSLQNDGSYALPANPFLNYQGAYPLPTGNDDLDQEYISDLSRTDTNTSFNNSGSFSSSVNDTVLPELDREVFHIPNFIDMLSISVEPEDYSTYMNLGGS